MFLNMFLLLVACIIFRFEKGDWQNVFQSSEHSIYPRV